MNLAVFDKNQESVFSLFICYRGTGIARLVLRKPGNLLELFLSFIITSTIIELTPGPNMAYLAVLSLSYGRRAGFAAVAGVALGLAVVGAAAALGVSALISSSDIAYQALRWCGVFYLLWLGWDGWSTSKETSPEKKNGEIQSAKFFRRGLITNLLNPKAAVFYVAVLPSFIDSSASILAQSMILTIAYVCVATFLHSMIVFLAGEARKLFENPGHILIVQRVLALMLIGIALWFAVATAERAS